MTLLRAMRREKNSLLKSYVFAGIVFALSTCVTALTGQESSTKVSSTPLYKQANAPIENRVNDLLGRMTLEEKVRQLDMYHGASELMSAQLDVSHATLDAVFVPDKAQALLGSLGVGSIHDLYPTPEQANVVQKWVIEHNRLGIPAIFIEEGLLGFNTGR
jgi:beta-glucosidase